MVGVDQCFPAAKEEPVRPPEVQGSGQRRLPVDPVLGHPRRDLCGPAHGELGELLVARPLADRAQIPPHLVEGIGTRRVLVTLVVHAPNVPGVPGVAAAHHLWRPLEQQHPGHAVPGGDSRHQARVAAADDYDVPGIGHATMTSGTGDTSSPSSVK